MSKVAEGDICSFLEEELSQMAVAMQRGHMQRGESQLVTDIHMEPNRREGQALQWSGIVKSDFMNTLFSTEKDFKGGEMTLQRHS